MVRDDICPGVIEYANFKTKKFKFIHRWSIDNAESRIKSREHHNTFDGREIQTHYHPFREPEFGMTWKLEPEFIKDEDGKNALELNLFLKEVKVDDSAGIMQVKVYQVASRTADGKSNRTDLVMTHQVPIKVGAGCTTLLCLEGPKNCIIQDKIAIDLNFTTVTGICDEDW